LNLWKPFRTFKICFLVSFLTDTYLSIKINFICLFFLVSLIHLKAVSENISSAIRGFFSVQCKDIGTNERIYPRHDLLWTTMAPRNPFSLNRTFISDRICPHSINITFCKNLFFNFVCRMSYFLLLFYLLKQERNPGMDLYAKNKWKKRRVRRTLGIICISCKLHSFIISDMNCWCEWSVELAQEILIFQ